MRVKVPELPNSTVSRVEVSSRAVIIQPDKFAPQVSVEAYDNDGRKINLAGHRVEVFLVYGRGDEIVANARLLIQRIQILADKSDIHLKLEKGSALNRIIHQASLLSDSRDKS